VSSIAEEGMVIEMILKSFNCEIPMRVLFVCTGNVFRSFSAERLLQDYCLKHKLSDIVVESAGTLAQCESVSPMTIHALHKYGVSAEDHVQRKITRFILDDADIVVAMAEYHQQFLKDTFDCDAPLFNEIALGEKTSVWDVEDVVPSYATDSAAVMRHIEKTVTHIHDVMPGFASHMRNFLKSSNQNNP
jgi:protein-tyrosine-phosphatase